MKLLLHSNINNLTKQGDCQWHLSFAGVIELKMEKLSVLTENHSVLTQINPKLKKNQPLKSKLIPRKIRLDI